ncbi:unnamed protein product [Amoebophrya sp. A25]|nr:unnamed protein product [Amoebophrya sp. A25]|eukprot:GSA25T00017875001.1
MSLRREVDTNHHEIFAVDGSSAFRSLVYPWSGCIHSLTPLKQRAVS